MLDLIEKGQAVLLTGPVGSGKTHRLRAAQAALQRAGRDARLHSGNALGTDVPLGAFAGVSVLPADALGSPAAVIDAFTRRRSTVVLLVDDVDVLDDASLYVITQLITTARLPAVLAVRDLVQAPPSIRVLYDRGDLVEVAVPLLSDVEAAALVGDLLGGTVTPAATATIVAAGGGNPLHLREIVRGSVDEGRLTRTDHGWDLHGEPVPTARLAQLVGERFESLDQASLDAATKVAAAGEYPQGALGPGERDALVRADVVEVSDDGWLRLTDPLDRALLRSRCPTALWRELAAEVVDTLRGPAGQGRSQARRQADLLALEHGFDVDVAAMTALAEHALGAFDERLALRAATAAARARPDQADAHRLAGLAASALGDIEAADLHLTRAHACADDDAERAAVAIARAQHLGLRHHDASAALTVLQEALQSVRGARESARLQRASLRWAAVAGPDPDRGDAPGSGDPAASTSAEAGALPSGEGDEPVADLVLAAVAGVISGPLAEATRLLATVRSLPAATLTTVPAGAPLVELTEVMALSYSGDVVATRRRLEGLIAQAQRLAPESLGAWEYALGFLELFSADAERAYILARSATEHLTWRDGTGLLPAAHALTGAAAAVTGRDIEAAQAFAQVPDAAVGDPKVVMLRGWSDAWRAAAERRPDEAATLLLDTAQHLRAAQHTYFAAMVAHCAVRQGRRTDEAAALVHDLADLGGGGLLALFARHATAMVDTHVGALEAVAADARELGVLTTAADTWSWLATVDRRQVSEIHARRLLLAADELTAAHPGLVLWSRPQERSTLLTERERQVAELAARRLTAKEIAALNGVSVNTVTNQLASAFRKLGVNSRAELRELFGDDGAESAPPPETGTGAV